ncbi:uncharacterized protein DUF2147 [Acinetobacter calcoaceticus]|uniref:Uncharacterized protein DUF2147 n=1 Tax=Acinetobacter calcoaceticus TaxID=471 RepID=A0A4R1XIX3_ACICA|nr:uncharacterized protein DUF2147 [Acinetobacter calcoaceticus]
MLRSFITASLLAIPCSIFAADPLHGTLWKTIDDKTKQPRALVKFTENPNGELSATIQKVLVPNEGEKCTNCVGTYQNKPLIGLTIIKNLKQVKANKYDNGSILDPQTGKTYSFNANLSADKKTLSGRGYIGISAIGRSQTWVRAN